jgi:hypothetical protein
MLDATSPVNVEGSGTSVISISTIATGSRSSTVLGRSESDATTAACWSGAPQLLQSHALADQPKKRVGPAVLPPLQTPCRAHGGVQCGKPRAVAAMRGRKYEGRRAEMHAPLLPSTPRNLWFLPVGVGGGGSSRTAGQYRISGVEACGTLPCCRGIPWPGQRGYTRHFRRCVARRPAGRDLAGPARGRRKEEAGAPLAARSGACAE